MAFMRRCAALHLKTQELQWFFARYLLLVVIDISPLIGGATRDHGFLSTAALFTPGQAGGYVGSSTVPTAHQTSLFQPLFVARCSLGRWVVGSLRLLQRKYQIDQRNKDTPETLSFPHRQKIGHKFMARFNMQIALQCVPLRVRAGDGTFAMRSGD